MYKRYVIGGGRVLMRILSRKTTTAATNCQKAVPFWNE
jgi:hypothetical protein